MENSIVADMTDRIANQQIQTSSRPGNSPFELKHTNDAIEILMAEGGESFYNYVKWLGLANDQNLVVLSSLHHYYYDAEEMNKVSTVVNLKILNQIKQIKGFLHSSFHVLPQKSNFIGCFVDNEKINGYIIRNNTSSKHNKRNFDAIENGIVSKIPFLNMLFGILDSRTNNYMSRRTVSLLLESFGFKVLNMTEFNGITYFHSQRVHSEYN